MPRPLVSPRRSGVRFFHHPSTLLALLDHILPQQQHP
ncbi:unnamed protein product [Tuber melanosporum]|uniref:(Perigord truffle) hypothetical protein n=1 Tax=Tuber melanosporum (strain Mel28) TaxID=656061 RepID=D5GP77_TUBMM|nr:uncharacterized protein GSTUM_00011742001 [Tuber melanosporum]CAZ86342.1 unnamed protein product [Tuber melanosporum]